VGELAAPYDMTLPSFVEHLTVLEGSGLVRSRKAGRIRTYELAPEQMVAAEDWLGRLRKLWERRFDQFDSYLLKLKQEKSE
jgi:DNA-binding transcriptional ArsR family regulator